MGKNLNVVTGAQFPSFVCSKPICLSLPEILQNMEIKR